MKLVSVEDLKENDVLAQDVLTEEYRVLLGRGTVLKQEYIEKLEKLDIDEVYLEEKEDIEEIHVLHDDIEEKVKARVKSILEQHVYRLNSQLEEVLTEAETIINNVLENEKIVEKIYDIQERSADLYEHAVSVCSLATLTALKFGLKKEEIYDVAVASLLHDLGLRYIATNYEDVDIKELALTEQEEFKKHTVYGYTVLKSEDWLSDSVKEIVLNHHEHLDGSGYPLNATKLSASCQIVAICDLFDEMICGVGNVRTHVYVAIGHLRNYSGIWYDEKLIDTFLQFTAVYPVNTKVRLTTGEVAVVIKQNANFPEKPIVKIVKDESGKSVNNNKEINLLDNAKIMITEVIN